MQLEPPKTAKGPDLLVFLRKLRGVNQSELAAQAGIDRTLLVCYERAKKPISARSAMLLGRFFAVDPRLFWEEANEEVNSTNPTDDDADFHPAGSGGIPQH
jgi:transcriptional regulator with XRE-family HTH domain